MKTTILNSIFVGLFIAVSCTTFASSEISSSDVSRECSDLDISKTKGNIVLYTTHLRLMQNNIEIIEAQGGMGFLGKKVKNYRKIYFFVPFIIPDNIETKIKKIKYFIEGENKTESAIIDWKRNEFKNIHNGIIEVNIPLDFDFSTSRLFISLQDNVWHSYLLIPHGLTITMLKEDGIPSELDQNGNPISSSKKLC